MDNHIEQKKKRFQFLHHLYEVTKGSEHTIVKMTEIGEEIGLPPQEINLITQYLKGEGLIKYAAMGGQISITHNGVIEVEKALDKPDQPTQYFPPISNIIYVQNMNGSQIQQGTINSTQTGTFTTTDLEALTKFIIKLKEDLPNIKLSYENRIEAEAEIATIEAQLKSSKPKNTDLLPICQTQMS